MSVGLKQFSFVFCMFMFLTVQSSHESCSATFLSWRCYFEPHDLSFSQPKPPVKTIRKPFTMASNTFLDYSVLLMAVPKL